MEIFNTFRRLIICYEGHVGVCKWNKCTEVVEIFLKEVFQFAQAHNKLLFGSGNKDVDFVFFAP